MDNHQPTTPKSASSSGPFGYQTRLLERTASTRSNTSSLSRTNSLSSRGVLPPVNSNLTGTRKWAPSHRVTSSMDTVRGKWEERAKAEAMLNETNGGHNIGSSYTKELPPTPDSPLSLDRRPFTPPKMSPFPSDPGSEQQRTPTYLKRRTMPAPIIASPLSPNTTGVSVEVTSPSSAFPGSQRIHLPTPHTSHPSSPTPSTVRSSTLSQTNQPSSPTPSPIRSSTLSQTTQSPPARYRRANTLDSTATASTSKIDASPAYEDRSSTSESWNQSPLHRRPTSVYGNSSSSSAVPDYTPKSSRVFDRFSNAPSSANPSISNYPSIQVSAPTSPQQPSVPVMSPPVYRSSYMSSKKTSTYDNVRGIGRKLGNHLPRIASGDGYDEPEAVPEVRERELDTRSRRQKREERLRARAFDIFTDPPPNASADTIAGTGGRLRLPKEETKQLRASPLPSSRLTRGLWADTQRHLLQVHEYLCHVGEAQQWIEGCLGERLGFGIVEMEDGLRNGVVLAKLVRVFQGEDAVRKIYDAPKLDFRHSDNINHFFAFLRHVGLPECFIFELTDLYEKKNIPKVIYCIHALSHLLARRGMAERINNLLGKLTFSDDQLQKTQKGLSGVVMPNFGNVARELAQEINEEPEPEVETEDERRDRLLLENESSIIAVQSLARGYLLRQEQDTLHVRMRLAERYVPKVQALCRGHLARRSANASRKERANLDSWILALQAAARGYNLRRRWHAKLRSIRSSARWVIKVQAQGRGILQRRRFALLKGALRSSRISVTKLQTALRARLVRNSHRELAKTFAQRPVFKSIVGLQACARGVLERRRLSQLMRRLWSNSRNVVALQAHCRGALLRRRMRTQMAKLEDVSHVVVRIQAAVRTYLARKRLLMLIRGLRKASPLLVGLQARARANLARQRHQSLNKALARVQVIRGVELFQARARAAIKRHQHREQSRQLELVIPEMTGLQSVGRGVLVRRLYCAWRDHLHRSHPVATILQAMLRGTLIRRNFREKINYYRRNLAQVVKIQSLYRAKETREQYRQLTMGKNVTVGTIKNFVHLLDDSEADFQEEIKIERLRKKVVEGIREIQALENDVSELDVKIALVVQNVKSFEELIKARRRIGADSVAAHAARASLLAAHGDPFAGPNTLDASAKRKLELYQQLFYLLQAKGEYLSRLFLRIAEDDSPEKNRRLTERVVLTLYGYGHDRREDYLLLKLFQLSIQQEISSAKAIQDVVRGHPMFLNVAVQYIRSKQMVYVRETLQTIIREVVQTEDLDLEANPTLIHRARISLDEMRAGTPSNKPKDVPFYQALNDPDTRAEYIRHLQLLQWWTEAFVAVLIQSTKKMPYNIRYLARETLLNLRERFPEEPDERYAACIARLVFNRYINPAIITPETFDIMSTTIDIGSRKNLAQISKILGQIMSGEEFTDDDPSYVPINEYVRKGIAELTAWLLQVADVADAETQYHAHEFLDAIVQPKPIYISPNEIYAMHGLLSQHLDYVAPTYNDPMRAILSELNGVPHLGSDELNDARDTGITLELTNRFAHVRDPLAEEKALWVQAKRGVLAILRVQPAQDLVESLMQPVTEADEIAWEDIVVGEMKSEQARHVQRRMPSTAGAEAGYRLEDIRSLSFKEVKAHTIFFLLELEKQGKITRSDGFQDILNAIAGDVRSKHRKRLHRQQEMESMNDALRHLAERKKDFEEQINSYHNYVETAMTTMQRGKGKKRFTLPFTKQYFHDRDLKRSGQVPQFGSFIYSAKYLYEKNILLSVDQYSPRQFDKLQFTISSNTAGVFAVLLESTVLGVATRIASEDVRMEDLLQSKYENRASLSLFSGLAKFNLALFLAQINKKFYV